MKKLRRLALFLVIALCTATFSGCGSKPETLTEDTALDERPQLTVYYVKNDSYVGTALGAYIYSHSRKYNISLTPFDSYEEMTVQLNTELAEGTGPDVVLLSENSDFDVYHALQNGQIADLSSYFAADENFDSDAYYTSVLNGGKLAGGQRLVPFSFSIDTLCVEKDALARSGYTTGQLNDFYDFVSLIETFFETTDNETLAFAMRRSTTPNMSVRYLAISGIPILDADGKRAEELDNVKILIEHLAAMQDEYEKKEEIWNAIQEKTARVYDKFICISDNANYLLVKSGTVSLLESARDTDYVSMPWKNRNGQVQPVLQDYGFICQNSPNKEAAYDLLRYLMDYEIPFDFRYPISIKKEFTEKNLLMLQHTKKFLTQDGDVEIHTLLISETEAEEIRTVLHDMADAVCTNAGYYRVISEKMKTYIDTRDMNATMEELQAALDEYLQG